jgi:hypothetical protein
MADVEMNSHSRLDRPAAPKYLAACVQAAPVAFDLRATLEKAKDLAADAARQGAKLILFPEAFVSAYPRGASFGATIGARSAEGRELFRIYHASSIEIPGPAVSALGQIARQSRAYLVMGVIERDGGTLYCTVVTFAPDGRFLGKHRKLMPTGSERLVWGFGDGSTLRLFDTEIGKLGSVICWENYMPMMRATRSVSKSIVRRPRTGARLGFRRCSISLSRAAASCCRATSSAGGATTRTTILRIFRPSPMRSSRAAAAASSIRLAPFSPGRCGIVKGSSPPRSTSVRSLAPSTISIPSVTTAGRTSFR